MKKKEIISIVLSVILYVIATFVIDDEITKICMYLIVYFDIGSEVVFKAAKNILKGRVFDENFLMTIATLGAFVIGQYPEGVAVMVFYQIGEMFQDRAVYKSKKSIKELMDIRPDYATLIRNGDEIRVSPYEVLVGDEIVVKPGERIPLDGVVIKSNGVIDTSALTGESIPKKVSDNDEVLSGCISLNTVIRIKVTKDFKESTVAKILDLVQDAQDKKANKEKFIRRFAKIYTPIVVIAAIVIAVIPPLIIKDAQFYDWIYRALSFLVASCPCALVISIPLGYFAGIGAASRNGVLIKGGNYLEALKDVDTVVFDKTGTLTRGTFDVTEINPSGGIDKQELLRLAAYAEYYSNHPIAISIVKAYKKAIDSDKIDNYREIAGCGISVEYDGKKILAGNIKLMNMNNIDFIQSEQIGTNVYISVDNNYYGYITISDEIKEESPIAVNNLKDLGVSRTVMLTGDTESTAVKAGKIIGIDKAYGGLLPQDKVEKVEQLFKDKRGNVIFVGDGINDAPVLARADIGIAMGGIGSDAAIEAADVIIMNDDISKIADAIRISRRTNKIILQNIIFSLGVKAAILILVAIGMGNMWEAVFADVGVTIIAVINSMRILKTKV